MTQPTTDPDIYVVVCSDLHLALGPYLGADTALKVAKRMNKEDRCTYVPVPITMPEGYKAVKVDDTAPYKGFEPRGYL